MRLLPMKSRISKKTRDLALCAIISALGVLVLFLASLVDVLDLSAAMIASILCVAVIFEAGGIWPWLTYAVTALLAILLLPNKIPAVIYIMTGYYPMVKRLVERLPKMFAWIIKIAVFNALLTMFLFVCMGFFPNVDLSLFPSIGREYNTLIGYAVGNFIFVLYDIALKRLIGYYFFVLRDKLRLNRR